MGLYTPYRRVSSTWDGLRARVPIAPSPPVITGDRPTLHTMLEVGFLVVTWLFAQVAVAPGTAPQERIRSSTRMPHYMHARSGAWLRCTPR